MKHVRIAILVTEIGVPCLIRGMLKDYFPGLVDEVKFGKENEVELSYFLEIPHEREMMIFASNPFKVKNYPSVNGSQDFGTWIGEMIDEICSSSFIYFSSFPISDGEDFYKMNHAEEMRKIFKEFDLFKGIKPNMPGSSSFTPTSATESIFQ